MATAIIRPTSHIYTKYVTYAERAYDNNNSTKLTAQSSGYPRVIFTNFDMSAIPADIVNGGKITNISLCIYGGSLTTTLQLKLVRDADSEGNYTDCGDGAIKPSKALTTTKEYSFDFPKATEYWNNNISAFMNGGFQARLYYIDDASSIYEVYAVVEYELPETSKVYKGTKKQSVYRGTKKISTYVGTNKIT